MNKREIRFEYGFNSVNGIVKKKYYLHEIPFMHDKCDVWQMLPVVYVRQFTGLKDKNGVDIYEGDIVKTERNTVEVFYGRKDFNVVFYGKKDIIEFSGWLVKNKKGETDVLDTSFCKGEIIGNIYQTKI